MRACPWGTGTSLPARRPAIRQPALEAVGGCWGGERRWKAAIVAFLPSTCTHLRAPDRARPGRSLRRLPRPSKLVNASSLSYHHSTCARMQQGRGPWILAGLSARFASNRPTSLSSTEGVQFVQPGRIQGGAFRDGRGRLRGATLVAICARCARGWSAHDAAWHAVGEQRLAARWHASCRPGGARRFECVSGRRGDRGQRSRYRTGERRQCERGNYELFSLACVGRGVSALQGQSPLCSYMRQEASPPRGRTC